MSHMLRIQAETAQRIRNYYDGAEFERMLIIYITKENNEYVDAKIIIPQLNDYKVSEKKTIGLHSEYLFECVKECMSEGYDGIVLLHNHSARFPVFSKDDRMAKRKFFRFFVKNNLQVGAGCAVYANKRITYHIMHRASHIKGFCVRI